MYIKTRDRVISLPDWEDMSETEWEMLDRAGYWLPDTTYEMWENGEDVATQETLDHYIDLYVGNRGDVSKIMNHGLFDLLFNILKENELACDFRIQRTTCGECNGSARGLQGGMRGYCYTDEDRYEMGEDDWNRMMTGGYDGPCKGCGAKGYHETVGITHAFEVNHDSIKYTEWLKNHKPVCEKPFVYDYRGKAHRRPDAEITEKMQKVHGDQREWVTKRASNLFNASGNGSTEQEAREMCEARFAANVEKYHFTNPSMTMRLEEESTYKWSIESWQVKKALKAWREGSGEFKLTYTPCFMTVVADWSEEKEIEVLHDLHEQIIVKRWTAYGSCSYDYPEETKYSTCNDDHCECIPAQEPAWAVRLYYEMLREQDDEESQARADQELYWAESGTPYNERY